MVILPSGGAGNLFNSANTLHRSKDRSDQKNLFKDVLAKYGGERLASDIGFPRIKRNLEIWSLYRIFVYLEYLWWDDFIFKIVFQIKHFFLFLTQLAAHQRPLSRISKVFLCMFESKYCASWTWILCCLDKNIISFESIYLMFISGHTFQGQNLEAMFGYTFWGQNNLCNYGYICI